MSGCRILSNKSLLLKDKVQNKVLLAESALMEGVILSVPDKTCNFWMIHWYGKSILPNIPIEYFCMHVPKENARLKQNYSKVEMNQTRYIWLLVQNET